jgi:hypothetical protein
MPGRPESNYRSLPKDVSSSVSPMSSNELLAMTQKSQERNIAQPIAYSLEKKVSIESSDPQHLMIISNVMYGSKFCDVQTFEKHMQIAQSLENTRVIFLGNLISNPPGRNIHTDVKTPQEQVDYMKGWIDTLDAQGKVLAAVRADYPKAPIRSKDRVDDVNDLLFEGVLSEGVSFPVMQNGGILEVGIISPAESGRKKTEQTYRLGLFSKLGGSKADMNKNVSAQRAFIEKIAGDADIAVVTNPYIADVTRKSQGNAPTRQELALVTSGTYVGNINGERPELTDITSRDKYASDGEPSGQVITLFSRTKETNLHLRPEHFVYDYMVNDFSKTMDTIKQAGKEADFSRSLTRRGVKLSDEDKQIFFQDQSYINNLLEEQHHPQRRRS